MKWIEISWFISANWLSEDKEKLEKEEQNLQPIFSKAKRRPINVILIWDWKLTGRVKTIDDHCSDICSAIGGGWGV